MDIKRMRGDTYADKFTVTIGTEVANLTGCTLKMTLDSNPTPVDSSTQVYQIIGDITDAVNGAVEFAPTAEQANRVGYFYYDIEMTDTYGRVRTLDSGTYTYKQDITK